MANDRQARVVITANASTAKKVIEEIDNLIVQYTDDIKKMVAAGQANTAECKKAESVLKALSQVQRDNIEDTKRLGQVVQDLTNTKLRDLRRAMGSGKSALAKLTGSKEDLQKADEIRKKMKLVGDQIRLIEGQYVKIPNAISKIKAKSDEWLDKAITQQKNLVATLSRTDAQYNTQLATLKKLEAEEDRRKGKMTVNQAMGTVNNASASASDLRRAQTAITAARDNTATNDTAKINAYNKALADIETRLASVKGKANAATISMKDMQAVLQNPKYASLEQLKQTIEVLNQKMQKMPAGSRSVENLRKKIAELEAVAKGTTKQLVNVNDVIARSKQGKANINELKQAYKQLEEELNKLNTGSKEFISKQKDLKGLKAKIEEVTGSVHKQGGAWQTAAKNLVSYVGLFGAFNMLKSKLSEIINLNLKFSDQLADIRKVSGWAIHDVEALSKRLAKIDTRNSIEQLNDLAYQGAKLGIGKYGVDGLTRFAEATAQIRMALHEDMGDEAIAQLAKMSEVMHDMERMGVSQSLLASGSAIFKLSATTTATGTNIMEFSKRLLGLGRTADLTTPQILALGSAADSMALMPEVASTAFNKFITTLQSKYAQVAQAVGMNQERLKGLLDQHKTMQAIVEVLEHMRDMGDLNALAPIMGDLGSEGARLTNVFASMASNVDMLKQHLATSTEEFKKATAVTAEFDIQNETSQALMERAANIWEKTFVNAENASGGIKDIAKAWYEMTKAMTESQSFMAETGIVLRSLQWGLEAIIGALPALINGLLYFGAIKLTAWSGWAGAMAWAAGVMAKLQTTLYGLVGAHTAEQKAAIASAMAAQAKAESMYAEALSAKNLALNNQMLAATDEELLAANIAVSQADTAIVAAQEALAASTVELSALTKAETASLLEESEIKVFNSANTNLLAFEEEFLTKSKGMATAMTNAESAALAKETAAKEANLAATKNLRMVWGAVVFISAIAVIDKMLEKMKALNNEEERNKEVTDKITNALATANKEYEDAAKNLKILYGELERNWNIEDERKRLMGEINAKYGEYIGNVVDEATKVSDLTQSYNDATDALREYYFYKQKEALKADLVAEEQHKGDVSFMKLQNMGGDYQNKIDLNIAKNAIKEYAKSGASSATIAEQLWSDFFGGKAPGDYYIDLSKLPLVGGMFPKDTFRSTEQEAMTYLHDFVKSYVIAQNNEGVINKNFPGEWTAPVRPNKNSKNNTVPTAPDGETVKNDISEFIANIRNFYQRQKNALLEEVADNPDITQEMQDDIARNIDAKMNEALQKAKEAIVLGKDAWNEFKQTMDRDIKERADENGQSQSTMLLEKILDYDTADMRKRLLAQHYKVRKKKLVENPVADARDRAYMDKMWLSASGDEEKTAKAEVKRQREVQETLLKHDYTGIVDKNTAANLEKLGAFALDEEQISILFGGDTAKTEAMLNARSEEIASLLKNAREHIVELYETDATTEDGRNRLLSILFGENWDQDTSQLKAIFDLYGEDMQAFYQKLIQYSDEYTEAQKKASDERKKVNDFLWSQTDTYKDYNNAMPAQEQKTAVLGGYRNAGQKFGMSDITTNDPELEMMKMRMEFAQKYYDFLEKHHASEKDLAEARKSIMQSQAEYAKKLTSDMFEQYNALLGFTEPLQTFGASIGEAFGTMREDAAAGKKAIRDAVKQMVKSFATNTLNMISQQQIEQANTTAHYAALLAMQTAFGKAKVAAENATGQAIIATKQANDTVEVNLEAVKEQQMVALRSAGIFGWCVSTLGPIAGPIAYSGMMAILMGLLNYALSFIGGSSSSAADGAKTNTKLVSGMLTYDSGNVQDLKPFFDRDGNMYWATEDNSDHRGVSLLTQPTATTINGQPSLVAENGPELVIGRETTKAMMQNDPQLLRTLYQYDRNHSGRHAYDNGNLASVASTTAVSGASASDVALNDATASNLALMQAVNALLLRLNEPIKASIDMYGRGGLYESNKKAEAFMRNR